MWLHIPHCEIPTLHSCRYSVQANDWWSIYWSNLHVILASFSTVGPIRPGTIGPTCKKVAARTSWFVKDPSSFRLSAESNRKMQKAECFGGKVIREGRERLYLSFSWTLGRSLGSSKKRSKHKQENENDVRITFTTFCKQFHDLIYICNASISFMVSLNKKMDIRCDLRFWGVELSCLEEELQSLKGCLCGKHTDTTGEREIVLIFSAAHCSIA